MDKQEKNNYMKEYAKKNPIKMKILGRKNYEKHHLEFKRRAREQYIKNRLAAIKFYSKGSMSCNCCSESIYQFLAIDHLDLRYGTGKEHRKKAGANLCSWIVKNGFPDGFQILCHNCNVAKGLYRICPHKLIT